MELFFLFILFVIGGTIWFIYKSIKWVVNLFFKDTYSKTVEYGEETVISEKEEPSSEEPLKVELKNPQFNTSRITEYQGEEIKAFEFRPQAWGQFIGQEEGKSRAKTIIKKAKRGIRCHFLVDGIKGHGKCHAKGTKILMANGKYKNVENITINDRVMGIDSKPRIVKQIGKGFGQLYKIIPTKGKSFIVNGDHILSLKKTGTERILNISVREYLNSPTTITSRYELYRVPIKFKKQLVPLSPYFLGLWLGDGNSNDSRITNNNTKILNWLRNYAKKLNLKFTKGIPKNRSPYICLSSGRGQNAIGDIRRNRFNIKNELRKLNLLNNKHIPDIYKFNSRQIRLQLLAGLIDSDGWLNDGYNYEITQKNEKLAKDIKYIAQSLGFFSYIKEKLIRLPNWKKTRKYFNVIIIGNCHNIPVKIPYKKASKRRSNKDPLKSGFNIKKLKKDIFYGFKLNKDCLYLIEDFIVNHNTTFVELLAKSLNAKLIERVGKQLDEDSLVDIVNEINTSKEKYVIFFLDEIETADWRVIKILNPIIEQFKINNIKIKPFIFVGATINKHILIKNNPDTLDRIPTHIKFARYTVEDIEKIVKQYRQQLYTDENISEEVMKLISKNCKFNPRTSISLLEDYIVEQDIKKVLKNSKIVKNGLNEIDIEILKALNQSKRALGANALAQRVKLSQKEYITEFEPFLCEYGYINRVPSRIITDKGKKLLENLK